MNPVKAVLPVAACLGLAGCVGIPAEALRLPPSAMEDREMQTRVFEIHSEPDLLSAGAGVLQDMGFVVDESTTRLGLVTGSKTVSAKDVRQIVGVVALAVLTRIALPIHSEQTVRVSVTTSPSPKRDNAFRARVVFQRTVRAIGGKVTRAETLRTPELYDAFFDKLSKSIFLEAHEL